MKQTKVKLNPQGEVDITIPEIEEKLYTIKDLEDAFNAGAMAILKNERGFSKTFKEFMEDVVNEDNL